MVNNERSLPTPLVNANKTVEGCLDACQSNSATVCGLSYYGGTSRSSLTALSRLLLSLSQPELTSSFLRPLLSTECYMTTTVISPNSTVIADNLCHYPCAGNPLENCGGSDALSVWNFASTSTATKARRSYYERKQQVQRKSLPPLRA